MLSRAQLQQTYYELLGRIHFAMSRGDDVSLPSREAADLYGDLERLRVIPESTDVIEELHLRFLARCRLLELDRFSVKAFIGAGRCGIVFRATDSSSHGIDVALKILFFPRNEEELQRFNQEGCILYSLNHPTIVRGIVPTQVVPSVPVQWYAMELVDNSMTLGRFASHAPVKAILAILAKVCDGLANAHSKAIVHRDLHLENILVLANERPKILDFGSAKYHADALTFRPVGSLKTCSPEKLSDPSTVDDKSDIFAIGCILYKLVGGRWPFFERTYGQFVQRLLACKFDRLTQDVHGVTECIYRCLNADPARRPTATELAMDLAQIADSLDAQYVFPRNPSEVLP